MSSCSFAFSGYRKDTAVYWGNPSSDGAGGLTFDDAVEVKVRWEDKTEMFVDAGGQEKQSQAVILVGQDMDLGGYIYLGALASLGSAETVDPLELRAAREIRGYKKIKNLAATRCTATIWV